MIAPALIYVIVIPAALGIGLLLPLFRRRLVHEVVFLSGAGVTLVLALSMVGRQVSCSLPWVGFGMALALRWYHFSAFIVSAAACFGVTLGIYSVIFLRGRRYARYFFAFFLLSLACVNGAAFADNLALLLFFWEGLLVSLFAMIAIAHPDAYATASKALIIVGISDLCMMLGIGITWHLAGTLSLSQIHITLTQPLAIIAFLLLVAGALAKAGAMPFHSWIPDAANDAPLPFMAILPAALEKLLGIYFLARICMDLFILLPHSLMSIVLMTIGAVTILLAVMMALVQKDYKRLLSYHAISQVGYMVLGIGTALPIGIIGGLFHMINHAMYKSCLFLTAGAVEKQAGTTDLEKLGGLARKMPVTFACFVVAAASISGVPPFNGFFSKELVYDAALQRHAVFYIAAVLGSFFTAASFLKLGHAAFLGRVKVEHHAVNDVPFMMKIPMVFIAGLCVVFGLWHQLPLSRLIQPIVGAEGMHAHLGLNVLLVAVTVIILLGALFNHYYGYAITGSGLKAVDHIHYSPFLHRTYERAQARAFDPYVIGMRIMSSLSYFFWRCDRLIDIVYDVIMVRAVHGFSRWVRAMHTGNYALYAFWSLLGVGVCIAMYVRR